jgi:hypothetical protein
MINNFLFPKFSYDESNYNLNINDYESSIYASFILQKSTKKILIGEVPSKWENIIRRTVGRSHQYFQLLMNQSEFDTDNISVGVVIDIYKCGINIIPLYKKEF